MENGGVYKIDGEHGNFEFRPDRILRSAGEMPLKPDFILLALKILPGVDPVKLCGNAVGPDTAFLVIQNGLGSEAALAEAFPENEVIGTIAYIGASRPKPGFIHQQDSCNITFACFRRGLHRKSRFSWSSSRKAATTLKPPTT
jgi:2-dehydropantoate 2-reductase